MNRPVLVHDDLLEQYGFGAGHPMGPGRLAAAMALTRHLGLLDGFDVVAPAEADDTLLELVHTPAYLAALRDGKPHEYMGIGTVDNPLTPGIARVSAAVVGATVEAARQVWTGRTLRAVNLSGGLHHAMPAATSGFCVMNDAAVAIAWLLEHGATRVAYLDLDAHHGDGVQSAFWNDPRVLTVSIHETPLHLFPHTGFPHETGGVHARGRAVNIAMPPTTGDAEWLSAIGHLVPRIMDAFRPEVLVSQHGADAHRNDTLTHLQLSMDGLAASWRYARYCADHYAGGHWVAVGGGGYDLDSVARAWTHLVATVADEDLDPRTRAPSGWLDGRGSPLIGDGQASELAAFEAGEVLHEWPQAPVVATGRKVLRHWGLQAW